MGAVVSFKKFSLPRKCLQSTFASSVAVLNHPPPTSRFTKYPTISITYPCQNSQPCIDPWEGGVKGYIHNGGSKIWGFSLNSVCQNGKIGAFMRGASAAPLHPPMIRLPKFSLFRYSMIVSALASRSIVIYPIQSSKS